MRDYAEPLTRLIEAFERLPGIGARTAERLAFHVLKEDKESAMRLARAIRDVKEKLRPCRECFNLAESELCAICTSTHRDRSVLCVVEHVKDLIAIEKTAAFSGLYHVLQGRVSPHEGQAADSTTLAALHRRLENRPAGELAEIILATNPDAEGDATSLVLRAHLADLGIRVTRLARGIPAGGSIEFANVEILRDALDGRRDAESERGR